MARTGEAALRANDRYASLPLHFRVLTLLTRASWRLNFACFGPLWRARDDLRAQERTQHRGTEDTEGKEGMSHEGCAMREKGSVGHGDPPQVETVQHPNIEDPSGSSSSEAESK